MDSVVPVQDKNFPGDGKESTKVPRTVAKAESYVFGTIPWNLANPVKTYHGIIVLRHPIDPRRMGLLERAVRRVKEGKSAVLLHSGSDERWWFYSKELPLLKCESVQDLQAEGKTLHERRCREPFKIPVIPFGALVEYHPMSAKDQSRLLGYALIAGEGGLRKEI